MRNKVLGFDSFSDVLSVDPFLSGVLDDIAADSPRHYNDFNCISIVSMQ